jgi:hypothetical protein
MMNHEKLFSRSIVTMLCVMLMLHTLPAYPAEKSSEELRREAFLRGGDAIRVALNAKPDSEPLVSGRIAEAIPPTRPPAPVPQDKPKGGGMSKAGWVALIGGFTVSGILIYHYATSPGASVRNCSTCK